MKIKLMLPIPVIFLSVIYKQSKNDKLLLVSYNVENLMDTIDEPRFADDEFTPDGKKKWNSKRYNKKINDISNVLCSIDEDRTPEIIALIEVENRRVVEDLLKTEKMLKGKYQIIHEETSDFRGIDVALLVNRDVFKYITHSQLSLLDQDGKPYRTREILFVKGLVGKDTMYVFVNHWKSRYGGVVETQEKRQMAAKILRERINKIFAVNPKANVVCLGDFNDTPFDKSLETILNASTDSIFDSKEELYNLTAYEAKQKRGTYSKKGDWYMLDNIIVSQNLLNKKSKIYAPDVAKIFKKDIVSHYNSKIGEKIPNRTYGGSRYYGGISDHFAVYAYLNLK